MRVSTIHIALGAIILAGMSACTQQERITTEHPVAIVDSLQQIVAEEVQARFCRTEAEWGVGILMDAHSGTVVAMYDTDSTLIHAQSAWELGSIISPLALLAAYSVDPQGWDTAVTVCCSGFEYAGHTFWDGHPRDTVYSLSDAIATSSKVAVIQYMLRVFEQQPALLPEILAKWGIECAVQDSACDDVMLEALEYAMGNCTVTPVQLAYLYSCVATGQHLRVPANGLDSVRLGLHRVVWDNNLGTASINPWNMQKAQSDKVRIAGKTGAARICIDGQYDTRHHRLSFVGYFPEDNPQYTCLVILNNPKHYGYYEAGADCGIPVRCIAERIQTDTEI
ncbi:MAG TPA: hypothetical protein DIW30_04365 [Bacteroidales bacterium]|nr:hypothetical protein [Bacteroidales bacterium]